MRNIIRACLTGVALAAICHTPTRAEDIDIYSNPPPPGSMPNVLIILDSSANWSSSIPDDGCTYTNPDGSKGSERPRDTNPDKETGTKMGIEKCALHNVVAAIPENQYKVGLMLFNESTAAIRGAYPRNAILPLDADRKEDLKRSIRELHIRHDKSNNAPFAKAMYEAYLYLTEKQPYAGLTSNRNKDNQDVFYKDGRYWLDQDVSCSNHVIFITNGSPGEGNDGEARTLLAGAGGDTTQIVYPPSSQVSNPDQANWADEFARFMRDKHSIVTHTVAVVEEGKKDNYPNFINNIAFHGGGTFKRASNADDLAKALSDIFDRIQSVSGVFASASLPISVNARGTYLNQVFMGMFLPDGKARQRWYGNLKQYKFAYDPITDSLELVDTKGEGAIDVQGGFIQPKAVSFWTKPSDFWVNEQTIDPKSKTAASDSPDGKIVPKGGAAQRLRETHLTRQDGRNVYTCVGCSGATKLGDDATQFSIQNTGISSAALDVSSAERDLLINWLRGTDNKTDKDGKKEENGPGGEVTVRPSIHGDVLHSRPAVVNYGGRVVLFYGSNDGMLHAVDGRQEGDGAGEHLWSFVAEEHFPRLKRLRNNFPRISFPGVEVTPDEPSPTPRDYFVDGPVSVYQKINEKEEVEKVYLYVGMRRGGRLLYAFDVTNPDKPSFLWKRTPEHIDVLGQTWSEPRVALIKGHDNPVIVMGAGYDPTEDSLLPAKPKMGDAVIVLDAFTGSKVKVFDQPTRPVAADVSLVDSDYDGYVDRAYAVDLGGKIYRIDFEVSTETGTAVGKDSWQIHTLADLGGLGTGKFFYAPDVVLTRSYAAVLVGSGDREKPLDGRSQDYFFTVIDSYLGKGIGENFAKVTSSDLVAQEEYLEKPQARGCYVKLERGEKVINAPLTIGGHTYFSTNQPVARDANSCTGNLGEARSYKAPLLCRTPTYMTLEGGGLPPSPVGGIVEVTFTNPLTGQEETRHVPFIIGGDNAKKSPIEGSKVKITVPPKRTKLYWHTETEF